jgi:hypothetical protein
VVIEKSRRHNRTAFALLVAEVYTISFDLDIVNESAPPLSQADALTPQGL